jgi:hypothetical protein
MPVMPRWTAAQLRRDLNARAERLARTHGLLHDLSTGASPSVLFGRDEEGVGEQARHGNFHPEAYAHICATPDWLRRLDKPHTASRRSRARHDWRWMELDAAISSDALLMNIFCHPGVFDGRRLATPVANLLNVDVGAQPCFGARPGVPLIAKPVVRSRRKALAEPVDRTEIDLTLSTEEARLFVEAKLTEADFQSAAPALLARYRDLETVFDVGRLPQRLGVAAAGARVATRLPVEAARVDGYVPEPDLDDSFLETPRKPKVRIQGYQLVRNVLAAYAGEASFCVLCDGRRQDLIEVWYSVLATVQVPGLAWRLKLLTWQELAGVLPADLQEFLAEKYGIVG